MRDTEIAETMAVAMSHAGTAVLFALRHLDEYTEFIHEQQANGVVSAAPWAGGESRPIDRDVLGHDLSVAGLMFASLASMATGEAVDGQVSAEMGGLDAELDKLLGS